MRPSGFAISAFTTVNNFPCSKGILSLLLPHSKLHLADDIVRRWGVHNLVEDSFGAISTANLRMQAKKTLDGLFDEAKGASNRLNILVQGHVVIQLLENGLRPKHLSLQDSLLQL